MQHMGVVRDHDRDDRDAGLNSEVESPLLEREEIRLREVGAGAFGEDPDALLVTLNLADGAVEGSDGGLAVRAVDEDGSA